MTKPQVWILPDYSRLFETPLTLCNSNVCLPFKLFFARLIVSYAVEVLGGRWIVEKSLRLVQVWRTRSRPYVLKCKRWFLVPHGASEEYSLRAHCEAGYAIRSVYGQDVEHIDIWMT